MHPIFDHDKIKQRLAEVKSMPPFTPDRFEPIYTVTQTFETGVTVTLWFVLRNGEPYFYDSKQMT